jgi:GAF domain-containing protein
MTQEPEIRILITDDDASFIGSTVRRLNSRGIKTDVATNARELFDRLRGYPKDKMPDAALIDYSLPDMGGGELMEKLLKTYPSLPIIVVTGLDVGGSVRAYGMGAYAAMQKPLDYNELNVILKELTEADKVATQIAANLNSITEFTACLVWELDKQDFPSYRITGWAGVDREFKSKSRMREEAYPRVSELKKGEAGFLEDVQKVDYYKDKDEARERGWVSLIHLPMIREGKLTGWIDCYKNKIHDFKTPEQKSHQLGYLKSFADLAAQVLHARQLTQHTKVVHEMQQNLVGVLQEKLMYDTILGKALATTGADCGWIYRFNQKESAMELGAAAGPNADKADKKRGLSQGDITGKVAKTAISLYVKDVDKPENDVYTPDMHVRTEGLEEKSVLSVPLRRGERTLGVLTVSSRHIDFFLPEDLQLLTSLAAIAAMSLERNNLTQHLQGISRLAAETNHFDKLAQYVVDAVHDLTDTDVSLWLMSKKENEGDHYLRLAKVSNPEKQDNQARIPTSPGISIDAEAMRLKRHFIINDIQKYAQHPPFVDKEALLDSGWNSFMTVPLLGKSGEPLGVITTLSKEFNKFTEDAGHLVQHFANESALTLQKQRHIRTLQQLADSGKQLTVVQADTKALLKKTVKAARLIADAELTVLYPYNPELKKYYDVENVVYDGQLKVKQKQLTLKPRIHGMSEFVRKHKAVIVENITSDEPLPIKIGLRQPQPLYDPSEVLSSEAAFIRSSKFIVRENIRAFIGVSLWAEEQPGKDAPAQSREVAILYFNYRSPRRFSAEELQVIDIFCHQIANVIHRNRLFYSLQKEQEVLKGVYNASLNIMEEHDLNAILEEIVEEVVRLLKAKGGKVYLAENGNKQDLKLVAAKGYKYMKVGELLPPGESMSRVVVETKKPQIENNYKQYEKRVKKLENYYSSVIEVPLLLHGEVLGVLGVFDNNEKRTFTNEDIIVLEKLAAQAALALYKGQLYEELDALYQTGLEIAKQAGFKEIARRILNQLKRVIEYDKATVQWIENKYKPRIILSHVGYAQSGDAKKYLRPVNDDDLVRHIVENQQIKIISHASSEPLWDNLDEETKGVKSWVCMPLVYADKVLGLLILEHKMPGYYTERDRPKLERFALQAAIGLYNASIEQNHLKHLSEFASSLSPLDPDTTKEQILHRMFGVFEKALSPHKPNLTLWSANDAFWGGIIAGSTQNGTPIKQVPQGRMDPLAQYAEQQKQVMLLPDDNPALFKAKGEKLLGPLWLEGEVCAIVEISSSRSFSDNNLKHFSSTVLSMGSEALYRLHLKERRIAHFKQRFNPYIVGAPIHSPKDFFGRESVVQKILDGIHKNNFLIEDERRIGKTSLLYHLRFQLEQKGSDLTIFFPIYINIQATGEGEFWKHLADSIFSIQGKLRTFRKIDYDFYDLLDDLDANLRDLQANHPAKELHVVLLMDEVDKLKDYDRDTLAKLRRLFQEEERIKVVMAGWKIQRHLNDLTSPWHNQLVTLSLGSMAETSARNLIIEPIKGTYAFLPEAIDLILFESRLKPMAIQGICFNAVTIMLNRTEQVEQSGAATMLITKRDVQQAIAMYKKIRPAK